jgi:hypothetical protein
VGGRLRLALRVGGGRRGRQGGVGVRGRAWLRRATGLRGESRYAGGIGKTLRASRALQECAFAPRYTPMCGECANFAISSSDPGKEVVRAKSDRYVLWSESSAVAPTKTRDARRSQPHSGEYAALMTPRHQPG